MNKTRPSGLFHSQRAVARNQKGKNRLAKLAHREKIAAYYGARHMLTSDEKNIPDEAAVDLKNVIVNALKKIKPHRYEAWADLKAKVSSAEFVAIDPVAMSISIDKQGEFSGLANVLIDTTVSVLGGREIHASLTIPALVSGRIANVDHVKVESFTFRFGTRSSIGLGFVQHDTAASQEIRMSAE